MNDTAYVKPNGAMQENPPPAEPIEPIFEEVISRRSPTIGALVGALAQAQLEFQPIKKDKKNPYYGNMYADLETVIAATRPALAKYGVVVMQTATVDVGRQRVTVTTLMAHSSGEWKENELTLPAVMLGKDGRPRFDSQSCGAAMTYGRRYDYQGIVGVAAEQDDDANSAAGIGSKADAQAIAKAKLEESAKSSDPKIAAAAKEGLAKINAVNTSKDLEGTLKASLDAQKDQGLFDEVSGVIQGMRNLSTSPAKGSRPYRKIAMTIFENGKPVDIEISAFDNFKMSDTTCFNALDNAQTDDTAAFIVERQGKYLNLKDIKQLGAAHWDARIGIVSR